MCSEDWHSPLCTNQLKQIIMTDKAILYNGRKAIGETRNFRFSVYLAMIEHPEITCAWLDNGGRVLYRKDIPRRYLNPKNYSESSRRNELKELTMY